MSDHNSTSQGQSEGTQFNKNFNFEDLNSEANQNAAGTDSESIGYFTVKSARKWIEEAMFRPIPNMLFGQFWHEGEICILFADTNQGKSILAVVIADSISRGAYIPGFILEALQQKVLYFDFELSDKQFENRYSIDYGDHYVWNENFFRAEINPNAEVPKEYSSIEEYINISLEQAVLQTGARVLIIDNITYLRNETERAKDALPLMKQLKALKKKYGLSILALAHTPKRDMSKPITMNDLQGSKMLINFCDSSFAIGSSTIDSNVRYLKQIKQRNTEQMYGAENVCLCQISKPNNFLKFEFMKYGKEWEHLRQPSETDKESQIAKAIELHRQGKSLREIGDELGISHMTVGRWLKDFKKV